MAPKGKSSPKSSPKSAPTKSPAKSPAKAPAKVASGVKAPKNALMCASPDLLWECLRNKSSFIRTSPGTNTPVMTAEPGNLQGINSFRFSGLANKNVLNVSPTLTGKKEKVTFTTRHVKASRAFRPRTMLLKTGLNKQSKKGIAAIEKAILGGYYRRDLVNSAKEKYMKVLKSFKKKKLTIRSRRAPKAD